VSGNIEQQNITSRRARIQHPVENWPDQNDAKGVEKPDSRQ